MLIHPALLSDLSAALTQRAGAVGDVESSLGRRIATMTWTGPAADRFLADAAAIQARLALRGEQLTELARRIQILAERLSTEIDVLYGIEVAARAWYAAHVADTATAPPWPAHDLPPSGDPTWRRVDEAFTAAGMPLHTVATAPPGAVSSASPIAGDPTTSTAGVPPATLAMTAPPGATESVLGMPVTPDEKWIIDHEDGAYATNALDQVNTSTGHAFGLGQLTTDIRVEYLGSQYQTTDPALQLAAMRAYIHNRYGTAANAVAHWEAHQWY